MNIRNLFRPDPLPLEVRPEPVLGGGVKGTLYKPLRPFENVEGSGQRWKHTDLAKTFRRERLALGLIRED